MTRRTVTRALLSVSDKTGLVEFAVRLIDAGVEIVSSGGTATALSAAGVAVTPVSDVTGSPHILGGRVKTLHPKIHGGILADTDQDEHRRDLSDHDIDPFQLVVVNLYPFEATVAREGVSDAEAIEQIDIGGPAMIRAAAKNHRLVGVVTSPDDYDAVAAAVEGGGIDDVLRRRLAVDAFARTAAYDAAIVAWFHRDEPTPPHLVTRLDRVDALRYGENPHQPAAIYVEHGRSPWWRQATLHQGKAMSFNNYADTEAAWRLVNDLDTAAAVIVKHTNACGAAIADTPGAAFAAAWECDPLSAFGGVVALNEGLDAATAEAIAANFVEVVIAPEVDEEAAAILAGKKNLRVLTAPAPGSDGLDLRRVEGGVLAQRYDGVTAVHDGALPEGWTVVAGGDPSSELLTELGLAWVVAAHTRSNAIVVVSNGAAVGVGAGDQSRIGAAERALHRAGGRAAGAVAASDAFLPFRDGLDTLAAAGIVALVEPGGSMPRR